MAMKIETGTGNKDAAKYYSEMLSRIYPDNAITRTMLVDQQKSLGLSKIPKLPVLAKKTETPSKLIESQLAEKSFDSEIINSININLLRNGKDDKVGTGGITQTSEEAVSQQLEPVTQVKSETLNASEFHIVNKGENLYRISLLYNIKMQRLIEWNSLVDASAIFDGKKLFLVAPSAVE
jgi:type IV pilus assembly protein PilF